MDVRFKKALKLLRGWWFDRSGIVRGGYPIKLMDMSRLSSMPIKLLDIGCAQDSFMDVCPSEWDKWGMDENPPKGNDRVLPGDINKETLFNTKEFDIIFAGEIIEHSYDDSRFLRECKRMLKDDGIMILTTPNLVSLKNRFLMLLGKEPRFAYQRYHYHVYTLKELKHIVREHFTIEWCGSSYILWSTNREKISGIFWEWLADKYPQFGEHFILLLRKR